MSHFKYYQNQFAKVWYKNDDIMSHSKYNHLSESVCKCGTKSMTCLILNIIRISLQKCGTKMMTSFLILNITRISLQVWYKNDDIKSHSKYNHLSEFFFKIR